MREWGDKRPDIMAGAHFNPLTQYVANDNSMPVGPAPLSSNQPSTAGARSTVDHVIALMGEFKRVLVDADEKAYADARYRARRCAHKPMVHRTYHILRNYCVGHELDNAVAKACGIDFGQLEEAKLSTYSDAVLESDATVHAQGLAQQRLEMLHCNPLEPGTLPGVCFNHSDGYVCGVGCFVNHSCMNV